MTKEKLEELLASAINALLDENGGSLETAMDDMGIKDDATRKEIKEWFNWDEDEEELEFELMVVYRGEEEPTFVDYFESLEDAIDYASDDPDIAHYQVYDSDGEVVAEDDWDEEGGSRA